MVWFVKSRFVTDKTHTLPVLWTAALARTGTDKMDALGRMDSVSVTISSCGLVVMRAETMRAPGLYNSNGMAVGRGET
jgi:hypothetical protein